MTADSRNARLFFAIDLSDEARNAVAAEQKRIRARAGESLRFVKPDQLHLTLAFMAAVEEPRVSALQGSIARGFELRPFPLAFAGLGVLPPRGRPRVLYLDVSEGAADVIALQAAVAARIAEQGIQLERRPFRPHLTLARWRDGHAADAGRILGTGERIVAEQTTKCVTLYESRLSPDGPTHIVLARGELTKDS